MEEKVRKPLLKKQSAKRRPDSKFSSFALNSDCRNAKVLDEEPMQLEDMTEVTLSRPKSPGNLKLMMVAYE